MELISNCHNPYTWKLARQKEVPSYYLSISWDRNQIMNQIQNRFIETNGIKMYVAQQFLRVKVEIFFTCARKMQLKDCQPLAIV